VDRAGVRFLISFRSAYTASVCAVEITTQLSKYNESRKDGFWLAGQNWYRGRRAVQDGDCPIWLHSLILVAPYPLFVCSENGQIISARLVKDFGIGKDVSLPPRPLQEVKRL